MIAANNWGKLKTVSQMTAIIAILLMQYISHWFPAFWPAASCRRVLILIATFFTVVSGIIYIKDNRDVIRG